MIVATVIVLGLAVVLFGARLVIGPSLADRVVALNGIVIAGMVLIAVDAMVTERGSFLPVLVVLAVA